MAIAKIGPDGQQIAVFTEFRDKELIKSVPGSRWNPSSEPKHWTVPLSWGSCVALRGIFGDKLTIDPSLHNWAWRTRETRIDPALALRELTELPDPDEGDQRLYSFQRVGVKWLVTAGSAILGDDMGSGKGVQLPSALQEIINAGTEALPAVVICPNSTKRTWKRELEKWCPSATPYVLHGSMAQRRKTITQAEHDPTAVFIVNIESIRQFTRLAAYPSLALKKCRDCDPQGGEELVTTAQCEVHLRELNKIPLRTVIFDEVHRAKDPKAKQTRAWWALAHQDGVTTNWVASGTPIATHPGDLWSILHGIAPEDFPTKSKFVDRYALMSWNAFGGMEIVGLNPATRDEFFRILDTRFRRMPKDLILRHLPPKIRTQRYVQLTTKQRKAYNEMASRMLTRLDDGTLFVAKNNLVAHGRLLQLSSSYAEIIKPDENDPDTWQVVLKDPSPKIDELIEILNDIGPDKQVAVCAASRQLIELTAKRLEKEKISYGMITGKVTEAERDHQLQRFQAGKSRVMLFTIAAGGTGLTMTAASTIVFMQRSWSMIENKQAEDRVHRIGSEIHASVNIIDIIAEDTVEETHQLPKLYEKLERLEEITRDRETLKKAGLSTADLDNEEAVIMSSNV
jgi:SNF2 family DNA or RNA helicase